MAKKKREGYIMRTWEGRSEYLSPLVSASWSGKAGGGCPFDGRGGYCDPEASWEPSPHGGLGRPSFRRGRVVCSGSSGWGLGLTVHPGLGPQQAATGLHQPRCRPGAPRTCCHPALSRRKFSGLRVLMIRWPRTAGQNFSLCFTAQLQRNKVRGPRRHCGWPRRAI